ncbi:MAG: hypothetical protein GY760_18765 [Deltaproteobacteria bacterium]|nr:hypothetical protein [Deltaproteobacteria bacterium]
MLSLLEKKLYEVLKTNITDTDVVFGPGQGTKKFVRICVSGLESLSSLSGEEILAAREQSNLCEMFYFDTTGKKQDFELPADIEGDVTEIEVPLGFTVKPGDDYFIEGNTLKFYHAPKEAKKGVAVFFKGEKAKGYIENNTYKINIRLDACCKELSDADAVFSKSLNTLMASFVDMGTIRSEEDETGVKYRILKPVIHLKTIERKSEGIKKTISYSITSDIILLCQLETSIALGKELPGSIIEKIQYQTNPVKK